MKKFMTLALVLGLAFTGFAQDDDEQTAKYEANYQKKLEKEFASKIKWEHSLEKALARAKKENKLVFGYFTRSYAN